MTDEVTGLRQKISVLEHKIKKLRLSRRILMRLLAEMEAELGDRLERLEKNNQILTRHNRDYRLALLTGKNRPLL